MNVNVTFLSQDLDQLESTVCIVVDVLRASSSIATLLGGGAARVIVAESVDLARAMHAAQPDALLCGEAGGLPPVGFDYGNSPTAFEGVELTGRSVILATSNGTRLLARLAGARAAYVGSLLNLSACARAAWESAAEADAVTIVCAGNEYGAAFNLEDAAVAGAFVEQLLAESNTVLQDTGNEASRPVLSDAALAALRLWQSYSEPRAIFAESTHGQLLLRIGFADDLDRCAEIGRYDVAPLLNQGEGGVLVLT